MSESRDIPGSSVNGIIPARILEWVAISSPCGGEGDLPDSGIKSMSSVSPAWQADSLPLSPPGKPLSALTSKTPRRGESKCLRLKSPDEHDKDDRHSAEGLFHS